MGADRPLLGIGLMLGFCVLMPLGDGIAKLLGERIPVVQLLLIRFGAQALILLPLMAALRLTFRLGGRVLALTALRTALHVAGIGAMYTALRFMPLADAIAVAFVMPFVMLLLGALFLGETVGPRRLAASVAGFGGTLMILQPSFAEVGPPALLPLGVAVAFALFMLITRLIAREADPISLQAVSGLMAAALLLPLVILVEGSPALAPVMPAGAEWALLAALGAIGTGAHLLMTWSLRFAPTATLAPMQYLEIPFATAIGWLLFRDLPTGLAALGIVVTIASGLYVVLSERALSRAAAAPAQPAPPAV